MLVLVGSSNSVNLTDGLDGLAIGLMIIAAGAMTVLSYLTGHAEFARYLELSRTPGCERTDHFLRFHDRRLARASCGTTRIRRRFSWATSARSRWAEAWAWSRCC